MRVTQGFEQTQFLAAINQLESGINPDAEPDVERH